MVLSAAILAGGALASGALGVAGSNASSKKQYEYQRRLQEQAAALNYRYNSEWAKNGPTFTRQGYESAGYNPMLAVQNGTSSATSYTSSGQAQNVDYNSGISNALEVYRLKNETQQSDAISDSNYATADKTKVEKAALLQKLPYVSKQAKAEYIKTSMESAKLENDIHYQNEYLNYLQNSLRVQKELGEMGFANSKDIAKIQAAAVRFSSQQSAAALRYGADSSSRATRYSADVGYESSKYRSWSDHVRNLGIGIGGLTGVYRDLKGSGYNNYPPRYPSYHRSGNPRSYFDYP